MGMQLREFTQEAQQEWISSGFQTVKITGAAHLSVHDLADEAFVLMEPVSDVRHVTDGDLIAPISAPVVLEIIKQRTGRYYQ